MTNHDVTSGFRNRAAPLARALALTALALGLLAAAAPTPASAQPPPRPGQAAPRPALDPSNPSHWLVPPAELQALRFRELGPFRGGRVTTVAGVRGKPHTFYFGATGGGVWKTESAGQAWTNISDGGIPIGSIGAVAVAPSNPDVLYVGTGSDAIRGNVSTGRGVYRSDDDGATWRYLGLREAGQIGRIRIHPDDPDIAYLAATGHPFGPNPERGVHRTRDGGESWEKVLFVSDSTGAIELLMNEHDPDELFAAMWRAERKPWTMISGAREGGIHRSRDGGDTWEKLGGGLPTGLIGKIGIAQGRADPGRLYAIIEAEPGSGIYRSLDGGDNWTLVNDDPRLLGRPWYFHNIFADPTDSDVVYVVGGGFFRSSDGAESFSRVPMPHSDHHDLWISPDNPAVMVQGNDGGAVVTVDGGRTWSSQLNQATAEMYSVTVDDQFPYRVYGSQQDNSTLSLPSAATGTGISLQHWQSHGGCETGPVTVHPRDPAIVVSGCFGGRLARYNRRTEQFRQIRPYPERQDGAPERELRYRIQWNAPVLFSRHDPDVLYHGSQYVAVSRDQGGSWAVISPDLTGNDTTKFGQAGGPITPDVTGVEIYSSLLQIAESPHDPGVLWTGSNDGRVHLTRDGGATWTDVTPPDMPQPGTVNRIEVSEHRPGTAWLAVYRYRLDDFRPFIYGTDDFGATWTLLTEGANGIPRDHPTRVVREDPERAGLLYAGTEFGLFASFDAGANWQPLQLDLPPSPVTDLVVHRGDLVVGTQGRGFWILDDITPLRHVAVGEPAGGLVLYPVRPAYRTAAQERDGHYVRDHVYGAMIPRYMKAMNPPEGATIHFRRPVDAEGTVAVSIVERDGDPVRTFADVAAGPGLNRFNWNLDYPAGSAAVAARAVPGGYTVVIEAPEGAASADFEVLMDPRLEEEITVADLQAQFDYLIRARDRLDALDEALTGLRGVREEARTASSGADATEAIREAAASASAALTAVEEVLVQPRGAGFANPSRIRSHLRFVMTAASSQRGEDLDARPTEQLLERLVDLEVALEGALTRLRAVYTDEVGELNAELESAGLAPIRIPAVPGRRPVS